MIKKIFFIVFSILFLAFAGMGLLLFINKDFIKNKAISSLNNELNAKVNVNGPIDLTLFESFPSINLKLEKVYIQDKLRPNDTLAHLAEVQLSLNPFSIIKKDYTIDAITLKNGFVHLFVNKNGEQNFDILKAKDHTDSPPTILNLKKINLSNVRVHYIDMQSDITAKVYTEGTTLSGVFEQKNFNITIHLTHLLNEVFELNETSILTQKELSGKVKISFDQNKNCYVFDKNELFVENNKVQLNGSFCSTENTINLTAKIEGASLKNALALVPEKWFTLTKYEGNGDYMISAEIQGDIKNPTFNIDFTLNKGTIDLLNEKIRLTNINLNGNYNTLKNENGYLRLPHFAFTTMSSKISGSLDYPDISKTIFNTNLKADIHHSLLNNYLSEHLKLDEGLIQINDLALALEKNNKEQWLLHKIEGDIDIQDLKGEAVKINQSFTCSGKLNGTKNYFSVFDFHSTFGKNNISFDGELKNLFELILNEDKDRAIGVFGKVHSTHFNLNDFIQASDNSNNKTEKNKEINLPNLMGKLVVGIDNFEYQNLTLKNLSINAEAINKRYLFKVTPVHALGGIFSGTINSNVVGNDFEINMSGNIEHMAIDQLFEAFNNFDLEELKKENIKGDLTADFTLSALWDNFNTFNTDKFIMNSTLSLKDGELNNFKPLMSLSGKLDVEQLSHLYFDDLSTNIIINKGLIQLPATEIKSSLLSLQVGGTHSFTNDIDYRLVLNLKNLLAAKFRNKQNNKENYVNDIKGGINIYVSITGTMDKPIIQYDKESVRKKIKQDFREEKQEFKNLFKKNQKSEFEKDQIKFEEQKEEDFIEWEE